MRPIVHADLTLKLILIVIASGLFWRCVQHATLLRTASAQTQDVRSAEKEKRVIEAEELRIVDPQGHVRAVLTVHPGQKSNPKYEDKPGLYLYHPNGKLAARFHLADDNGSLELLDQNGGSSVSLGMCKRQPNAFQGGYVIVSDTNKVGATLGTWMDWEQGMGPASSLKFFSGLGRKITWEAK
jgi:hypothetical protein